jgi:site-specific recombinase XerD
MEQLKEFLDYLRTEKNCSQKTIINYGSDIKNFIKIYSIQVPSDISKQKIRAFISHLAQENKEATTRNRNLSAIKSFCKFLHTEDFIKDNPSTEIASARTQRKLPVVYSIKETTDTIDAILNVRDKAIVETLYGTGVRVSELVNIKFSDIDFASKTLKVFGKGSKERVIPINDSAISSILQHLQSRKGWGIDSYVFQSPLSDNNPITTRAIYDIVKKNATTLNKISPHKLRHSFATHLLSNGANINEIQKMLGHENINTTTIYAHVSVSDLSKAHRSAHPRT